MAMGGRRTRRARRATLAGALVATGGTALVVAVAPALSDSTAVSGRMTSEPVTGPQCLSPIGSCTRGTLKGAYKGTFTFTVSELIPTVESPSTSVVAYVGDMTLTTAEGTLTCEDTGALTTTSDRSVASVCTVTGGTGAHAGATGRLRITGVSPAFDGGTSDTGGHAGYEGIIRSP